MTRPVRCVSCGGPKESQRGMVCCACRTTVQKDRWKRIQAARRLRLAIARSTHLSSPVADEDHRYDAREPAGA